MDFLEDVPQQFRNFARFTILDESLDVTTKLGLLRQMGLEERVLSRVVDYLDPRQEEPVEEEVAEEEERADDDIELIDFRDLLSDARRNIVNMLIDQGKWENLKKYMAAESPEIQQAFEAFMRLVEDNGGRVPISQQSPEPEVVSIETTGENKMEGESLQESFTSSASSEPTPPPSSFKVQPESLDCQEKQLENNVDALREQARRLREEIAELERAKELKEEVKRLEMQKMEMERQEAVRVEEVERQERLKQEELEREAKLKEAERLEAERLERERLEEEARLEDERRKQEEVERQERERLEAEIREKERLEVERQERLKDEEERTRRLEEAERVMAERQRKLEEDERLAAEARLELERQQRLREQQAEEERVRIREEAERLIAERQRRLEEEERLAAEARLDKERREEEARQAIEAQKKEEAEREEREREEAERQKAENLRKKQLEDELYRDDDDKKEAPKPLKPVVPPLDPAQFTKNFPKKMNILVLGETGVGKSTYINAFLNFFKYGDMNQARAKGVEVLIKTVFTQMDKDLNKFTVEYNPTISSPDDTNDNEDVKTGESSTQMPKAYAFKWGPKDDQKTVTIIDTPGIGDKRGVEKDKENFSNILRFIADYPEIHAILILLKPNNANLNVTFRFCIFELLTHLHVSARNNIMFCFTNSRQTLYAPGETLPALERLMEELEKKRGFRVPLNQDNIFCFDSESYRFLCAWGRGIRFSDEEVTDFAQSWAISVDETFRLLHQMTELQPHQVQNTLSVNNVRAIVFALSRPIAELLRNIEINRVKVENKINEVKTLIEEKGGLDQLDLYVEQVSIHAKELSYPMTVCAGANCISMRKFNKGSNDVERIVYDKKCHCHCYLSGIKVGHFPNKAIKECWCFGCGSHPERCNTCSCDWQTHLHIRYDLIFTTERVIDPTVIQSRNNNETKQRQAEVFLLAERRKLRGLEELSNKLRDYCSEFAAFIHVNSLLPYNDVYLEYVDFLIREEEMKISNGASSFMRDRLIEHRTEYEETVKHLRAAAQSTSNRSSQKTPEDITAMLQELRDLPNGGQFLRDVERLETLSVRQEQQNSVTNVNLRNSHFNTML